MKIKINKPIVVECEGQNSKQEWELYEHEVQPGIYDVHEDELIEGVLYCLCDEIMRGDSIIIQPFDFEVVETTPA